jgi:AraC-like DNA-binding protein
MQFSNNINTLNTLMFYSAPASHSPQPYQIPEGCQLVELITDGVVFFEIDGIKRPCRRGTIFWHIAGDYTIHETTREEPYHCLVFKFKTTDNLRSAPRVSFWRGSNDALSEFTATVHSSFSNCAERPEALQILSNYCAAELLMHARSLNNLHARAPLPLDDVPDQRILRDALLFLEKNLSENISIDQLAEEMKIPRNKLFALFRGQLHQTPYQWLQARRLQQARHWLESSTLPIKEIAAACGFEHTEVFHRCFVKNFGETPKKYRQNHSPYRNLSGK